MPELANDEPQQQQQQQQDAVAKPANAEVAYDPDLLPDMLPVYYKRLFPHISFYRWLSYANVRDVFTRREISFTLHDDIYIRYLSFYTQNELEKEICARNPYKIDIGPVMNKRPRDFRSAGSLLQPEERELVFDIDMTDYDDVRTCCSGAGVCRKCWKFMSLAVRILDQALREDFGFEHLLWVFSGRRGVHCWVCDENARELTGRGRTAVAEYLQISTKINVNNLSVPRTQLADRLHHYERRALGHIEAVFEEIILEDQNLFGTIEGLTYLCAMIHDEIARKEAMTYLQKNHEPGTHSRVIWTSFVRFANSMRTRSTNSAPGAVWGRKLKHIVEEIQLGVLYPRLDINVTKGFNHLLKAPFCIHPATGKVCLPFNANAAAKFDPTTVPTIAKLLQEINVFDDKTKSNQETPNDKSRIKDYKKTSMFKGVYVFEEFLRKLENSLTAKFRNFEERMEF